MPARIKTAVKILLIIITVCFVLLSVILFAGNRIIFIDYRELGNIFHIQPTEHYGTIGSFPIRLPGFAVNLYYPKKQISYCK